MPALKWQPLLAMHVALHVISLFIHPITCMAWAQKHPPEGIGHRPIFGAFEDHTSSAILISSTFAEQGQTAPEDCQRNMQKESSSTLSYEIQQSQGLGPQ